MVVPFMAYAFLASAVLGLAALVAEHALRQYRLPARWVWAMALASGVALPALFFAAPEMAWDPSRALGKGVADALYLGAAPIADAGRTALGLEWSLRVGWVALTGFGLLYVTISALRLRLARRRWRNGVLAGFPVLVSENVGPAVVGIADGQIVMPRWALRVEDRLQRLMLAHEQEHLMARDPLLLVVTASALIAMPWNPALWWIAQRLRLAVEVDCDARVLRRARSDVGTYGSLLLEVGRRGAGLAISTASFSRPRSSLEHRIRAMTDAARPGRLARAAGAIGVVVSALTFVLVAPHPIYGFCKGETQVHTVAPAESHGRVVIGVIAGAPRVVRTLPPAGG